MKNLKESKFWGCYMIGITIGMATAGVVLLEGPSFLTSPALYAFRGLDILGKLPFKMGYKPV